jgi:thioredoxin-dependent peroxiredoxin
VIARLPNVIVPLKTTKGRHMTRELEPGDPAPTFTLPRNGHGTVTLKDFAGRKLVLFFYPKADTPGCTREAIAFSQLREAFAKADTAILGVSADSEKSQTAFKTKHALTVDLASDQSHKTLTAYGVWREKSMYGRTYLGIVRTTVLIGRDARIAQIWRNVKVAGHADAVLAAAQAL